MYQQIRLQEKMGKQAIMIDMARQKLNLNNLVLLIDLDLI